MDLVFSETITFLFCSPAARLHVSSYKRRGFSKPSLIGTFWEHSHRGVKYSAGVKRMQDTRMQDSFYMSKGITVKIKKRQIALFYVCYLLLNL